MRHDEARGELLNARDHVEKPMHALSAADAVKNRFEQESVTEKRAYENYRDAPERDLRARFAEMES